MNYVTREFKGTSATKYNVDIKKNLSKAELNHLMRQT